MLRDRLIRGRWPTLAVAISITASPAPARDPAPGSSGGGDWHLGLGTSDAQAQTDQPRVTQASFLLQSEQEETTIRESTETVVVEDSPQCPFSFDVTYYLYSDYIFRGINFSEYDTEGREKLNHQMTTTIGVDVAWLFGQERGTWGTFAFDTFFEWFAAQKEIDPDRGGQNLQEVDYILSWSYDIEPIATGFTVGYTFYAFPNASDINTQEWYIGLEHNDAWMWKWLFPDNEDGVLNPSFLMAQDVGVTGGGMWFEIGLSHDFEVFENFALTPGMVFAIDHRYLNPLLDTGDGTTGFAYIQYGLTASYSMGSLLNLPEWAGDVLLSGFLYFNDAVGNAEDSDTIQDEFFGGMSVGWSF